MKTKNVKISELTPDDINANRGTPRGSAMLEKSLREYGAGRSVLVDKAGRIIAGNKTIEAAGSIGLEDAVMVETDGTRVVIVKRTDLDLDSPQGRGLAIADNRVAEVGLDWDIVALEKIGRDLDLGEFWFNDELPEIDFDSMETFEDQDNSGKESIYTSKIASPIYEPTGACPAVTSLCDSEKSNQLIAEIKNAQIEDSVKEFLIMAAKRHLVFDYQNIAEFYAHADNETKSLMERSALVIIDHKRAIEEGFLKLSEGFMAAFEEEQYDE